MRSADTWRVAKVEPVDTDTTTPLRGRAWLLGGGATAYCVSTSGSRATISIGVDDDGRLYASAVTVASDRTPVTAALLRTLPIGYLIRQAFASLGDDVWRAQRATDAPRQVDAVVAAWRAVQGGHDAHRATQAVADRLSLSRGHVSRLLTQARREGLIPR